MEVKLENVLRWIHSKEIAPPPSQASSSLQNMSDSPIGSSHLAKALRNLGGGIKKAWKYLALAVCGTRLEPLKAR